MILNIAVVANTLDRVKYEMDRFYEMNREDIYSYRNRCIVFKDGSIMRGHTLSDNQWMKMNLYDQIFCTSDLKYSSALIDYYYRLESRSCIPTKYLLMPMEEA